VRETVFIILNTRGRGSVFPESELLCKLKHVRNPMACVILKPVGCWIALQHHRVAPAGRHRWKSSSPTPLLKQGHLEQVVQDHVA